MFNTLFANLRAGNTNEPPASQRRFSRRDCDTCVVIIGDNTYPVENWSMGGALINVDSRPFGLDNEIDITLRFKMRDDVIDVSQRARVIRKTNNKVAFEFAPLTRQTRSQFQNVIDDYVTSRFADSQQSA